MKGFKMKGKRSAAIKRMIGVLLAAAMTIGLSPAVGLKAEDGDVITFTAGSGEMLAQGEAVTQEEVTTKEGVTTQEETGGQLYAEETRPDGGSSANLDSDLTITNGDASGGENFSGSASPTSIEAPEGATDTGGQVLPVAAAALAAGEITITFTAGSGGVLTPADVDNQLAAVGLNRNSIFAAEIDGTVTSIGNDAFNNCSLTSVTIMDGVTSIGDNAFYNCAALRSVVIPYSVTSIDVQAFSYCIGLTEINVSADNVKYSSSIDGVLFDRDKTSLVIYPPGKSGGYSIPNGVTSIGDYAFYSCDFLMSVDIPSSVTSIGDYAFEGCDVLMSLTILDAKTSIGAYAFSNCYGLNDVAFGNGVTSIGDYAFYYCPVLTDVNIPGSVTSIGDCAFYMCGLTSVVIPNSVTSIGDYAFEYCSDLVSLTILDAKTSIGAYAFSNCYGLNDVAFGNGVTSIGDYAFYYCPVLTDVVIPDSATSIGEHAFLFCNGLTKVDIGNGVTSISNGAFEECAGLISVKIGNSVESIGDYAFANCWCLKSVTIPNKGVTNIGQCAFLRCSVLENIVLPYSVTSIGDLAFSECTSLKKVDIPDSVTSIGEYAFQLCTGITSIVIPGSVANAGINAFSHCTGLTSVVIKDGITSIVEGEFAACSSLTSIIMPDSVISIDKYAFAYCTDLTSFGIRDSVTIVGDGAFYDCSSLTSVNVGKGLGTIGYKVFSGTKIVTVTLPPSVTLFGVDSTGSGPFAGMPALERIVFSPGTTAIAGNVFAGITGVGITGKVNVFVPKSVRLASVSPNTGLSANTNIKLYGFAESDIEQYASDNGYNFYPLPTILPSTLDGLKPDPDNPDALMLPDGYVDLAYSFKFDCSAYSWMELVPGTPPLPPGTGLEISLQTSPNFNRWKGEIYGAPSADYVGKPIYVTVQATDGNSYPFPGDTVTFKITVQPKRTQTQLGLYGARGLNDFRFVIDKNTGFYKYMGTYYKPDDIFIVDVYDINPVDEEIELDDWLERDDLCDPDNFIDLWIDGERQTIGVDYSIKRGSTIITVFGQTMGRLAEEGPDKEHTISAEFKDKSRERDYQAAENFKINVVKRHLNPDPNPTPDPDPGPGNGGQTGSSPGNSGSGGSSVKVSQPKTPNAPAPKSVPAPKADITPPDGLPFIDVHKTDWFYDDIKWVYQNGVMIGESKTIFAPNSPATPAMIALTLARAQKIDLSKYSASGGKWYAQALDWAAGTGVFDSISDLAPGASVERGQMMTVLIKLPQFAGADAALEDDTAFPDGSEMTAEELSACKLLHDQGVISGKSGGFIDPRGVLTRAELAALVHRIEKG